MKTPAAHDLRERAARPFRQWSLTWRLVAVLVVLLITALTLSGLATATLMRAFLTERASIELRAAAAPVAQRLLVQYRYLSLDDIPSSYTAVFMSEDGAAPTWFEPASAEHAPAIPRLVVNSEAVTSGRPFLVPSQDPDGPEWLVLAGELQNDTGTFAVATSLYGIDLAVRRMGVLSVVIGALLTAACVIVGWFGFRRAFRPLRTIEDTASAIAAGDLTRRVPIHAAKDEVQSLSRSLNVMLSQIESSFRMRENSEQRMRRFVTDASHELRTPLATVRGYAELYRQGAVDSPEATAGAMRRIEDEATRMAGLVEDLLTLARLDDHRPRESAAVDLTVVAGDTVADARARENDRSIRLLGLGGAPLSPVSVLGDEARIRQVVTNLLANALRHTPAGTPVEVAVGATDGWARVEVRDHGPGIPPERRTQVFERFYRDDPARGRRDDGGHGLGLAIVAAIVENHGGRVGVTSTPGGGATFVVDLPVLAHVPTGVLA